MDTIFGPQSGWNLQVYVDDIVVNSTKAQNHLNDLRETFERVKVHNMRLNPAKCSFGRTWGNFLEFLLTQWGIEADLSQIKAIRDMLVPKFLKDLQLLIGCIAVLRCFIPQSLKRRLPMYEAIKIVHLPRLKNAKIALTMSKSSWHLHQFYQRHFHLKIIYFSSRPQTSLSTCQKSKIRSITSVLWQSYIKRCRGTLLQDWQAYLCLNDV